MTSSPLLSPPPSLLGRTFPRLLTPPRGTTSEAARVLRTAASSGLLTHPIPWQVYTHARLAEMDGLARMWRRAGLVVGRGNGKSDGILCPYVLDSLEQGIGVLGLAQNLDVAMETFNKVADTIEADPHLSRRIRRLYRGKGSARVDLINPRTGKVAVYRPAVTAKKCRGPRAPRLAVDESAYVSDDVLSAARYVQQGSGHADLQQLLAVCTAGDDAENEKGELQWFARMRAAHLEKTDPRLLWLEYSIPDDADPRDPTWWPYGVPALGHLITPQEIEDNLDDPAFVTETLSRWGVTTQRAIPADKWNPLKLDAMESARMAELRPAISGLGIAVTMDSARTALVAGYHFNGRRVVKVLDERPGTGWAVDVAKEWTQRARVPVTADEKGPSGPLVDSLKAAGVNVDVTDLDTYAKASQSLLDDVRGGVVAHFGQPALDAAVAAARMRDVGDRRVWARRAGEIAALEAATLALIRLRHAPMKPRVR